MLNWIENIFNEKKNYIVPLIGLRKMLNLSEQQVSSMSAHQFMTLVWSYYHRWEQNDKKNWLTKERTERRRPTI